MEQFRHIGKVLGSLNALMLLRDENQINQRQCSLLLEMFSLAFNTIAEEIKQNLRLEEKNTKWKVLDQPLRDLYRVFKDGELYIKYCVEAKDWWGKAICLHKNKDCVEFHIHNLLSCFPAVIEAIEAAGEISGLDEDEMKKRSFFLNKKYTNDWNDPKLFQWKFGKQYLVPRELCSRLDSVWKEDRSLLLEALKERKGVGCSKLEQRLGELLINTINGTEAGKLFPASILLGAKDYHMRRRLGIGSEYKEVQWLGESFAVRHFYGEIEPALNDEIPCVLSLSHPNVVPYLCGFYDEEKKECFLVMELMSKDLCHYIKETNGPKRRAGFSLPVVMDIMLQIARGMEYLHSRKIYHGNLNPSNVLLKPRSSSCTEGPFHVKVSGYMLSSIKNYRSPGSRPPVNQDAANQNENDPFIWLAPEVLAEQEQQLSQSQSQPQPQPQPQPVKVCSSQYSEKADVYSFGMLCFELLTGKIPFEDGHLQGDKMSRNIRAGERPLFPFSSPKYLANLTRKCWQTDPAQRPSFASIGRILRYMKRFLVMNPDLGQLELPMPVVDCWELEAGFLNKSSEDGKLQLAPVSRIPFQMFVYRLVEKERTSGGIKDASWDSKSEAAATSIYGQENHRVRIEDTFLAASGRRSVCTEMADKKNTSRSICSERPDRRGTARSVCSEMPDKKILSLRRLEEGNINRYTPGTTRTQSLKSSPLHPNQRKSMRTGKPVPFVMTTPDQPKKNRRWF